MYIETKINDILVSIIVPTFNGKLYIKECIDSIINQTYQNLQIIVVDDCSIDSTADFLLSVYENKITIVKNLENLGFIKSVNIGLSHSTGKYAIIFGQDDVMIPDRIRIQVDFMEDNLNAVASFANSYYIRDSIKCTRPIYKHGMIRRYLFKMFTNPFILFSIGIGFNSNSTIFKLDALTAIGGYSEYLKNYGESFTYYKMAFIGPIYYQNETLSYYRIHNSNMFGNKAKETKKQARAQIFDIFFLNERFKHKRIYKILYTLFSRIK